MKPEEITGAVGRLSEAELFQRFREDSGSRPSVALKKASLPNRKKWWV